MIVDESGRVIDVAGEIGAVGSGVVGLGEHGAWCWYEVVARDDKRVVVRERTDWGDPEA